MPGLQDLLVGIHGEPARKSEDVLRHCKYRIAGAKASKNRRSFGDSTCTRCRYHATMAPRMRTKPVKPLSQVGLRQPSQGKERAADQQATRPDPRASRPGRGITLPPGPDQRWRRSARGKSLDVEIA
jgi:hypothetical protein